MPLRGSIFFKHLTPNKMNNIIQNLTEQFAAFRAENPKVRIRVAARLLGVSEAQLVVTNDKNCRLKHDFENLLKEVNRLGYVTAITRNNHAVHERQGTYTKASFNGHVGLVANPDIDLRLFMNAWHFGFSVQEGDRRSFQFFDKDGEAVHKIYLTEQSDVQAYETLIATYRAPEQDVPLQTEEIDKSISESPDSEINVAGFQQAWIDLKDTHHFF